MTATPTEAIAPTYNHLSSDVANPTARTTGARQSLRRNRIGGFLTCTSERRDGAPVLVLRHYNVAGAVVNEDVLTQELLASR